MPPAALVTMSVVGAQGLREPHRERDLARRESLVAVDPALERHDAPAAERAHHESAAVADHVSLGMRESGDLGEGDDRRRFDSVGEVGETGAQNERDVDRAERLKRRGEYYFELVGHGWVLLDSWDAVSCRYPHRDLESAVAL